MINLISDELTDFLILRKIVLAKLRICVIHGKLVGVVVLATSIVILLLRRLRSDLLNPKFGSQKSALL